MKTEQHEAIAASEVPNRFPLNRGTLANLRCQGKGPKFYKIGKKVIYRVSDLEEYLFGTPGHGEPISGYCKKG